MTNATTSANRLSRKPLARCVAVTFALAAPTATLATTVSSCQDDGTPGTLRSAIAAAAEGGSVDFMAGLACANSKITLIGTAIPVARNTLTINGNGTQLKVDASGLPRNNGNFRVLSHTGSGTLTINGLTLEGGYILNSLDPSYGGCLSSAGNVVLNQVTVTNCLTKNVGITYAPTGGAVSVAGNLTLQASVVSQSSTDGPSAVGGGVYAHGDLTLDAGSGIAGNSADATTGTSLGGGAYVKGKMTLTNGSYFNGNSANSDNAFAKGGGAYVFGKIDLSGNSSIKYNSAVSSVNATRGGGLYAKGDVALLASFVSGNNANGGSGSHGGGAYVRGNSSISYSEVKYNKAYGAAGYGGGLELRGATNSIVSSTVRENVSYGSVGGVNVFGAGAGTLFELKNSTISGNSAGGFIGGLAVDSATVKLFNSTIAFNTAASASGGVSPGAVLNAAFNPVAANLQSSLMSNNGDAGGYQLDFSTSPTKTSVTFNGGNLAAPANNLIRATLVTNLPTDTKQGFCPHLGPLRDNGGLTWTHALMSKSVAIDSGNDIALGSLYDQRGSAAANGTLDYTRFSGLTAKADIGAYEVQQNDVVFNTDFDDCPALAF